MTLIPAGVVFKPTRQVATRGEATSSAWQRLRRQWSVHKQSAEWFHTGYNVLNPNTGQLQVRRLYQQSPMRSCVPVHCSQRRSYAMASGRRADRAQWDYVCVIKPGARGRIRHCFIVLLLMVAEPKMLQKVKRTSFLYFLRVGVHLQAELHDK